VSKQVARENDRISQGLEEGMQTPESKDHTGSVAELVGSLSDKLQTLLFALAAVERQTEQHEPLAPGSVAHLLSIASSSAKAARSLAQRIAADHPQFVEGASAPVGDVVRQVPRAA
jgi:hypothetical protein